MSKTEYYTVIQNYMKLLEQKGKLSDINELKLAQWMHNFHVVNE